MQDREGREGLTHGLGAAALPLGRVHVLLVQLVACTSVSVGISASISPKNKRARSVPLPEAADSAAGDLAALALGLRR